MKIFWSWQSDTPGKIGRHFVRDALTSAIERLKEPSDVDEPTVRETREALHLDQDRQGVAGSPDLARTILDKIDACAVFVGDVTPVARIAGRRVNGKRTPGKKLINSNVALELGYALKSCGDERVLTVMNTSYGSREELPFDLRHKAGPITFTLPERASRQEIEAERVKLTAALARALSPYVQRALEVQQAATFIETPAVASRAAYFAEGEVLAQVGEAGVDQESFGYQTGGGFYLRLIPTTARSSPIPIVDLIEAARTVHPLIDKFSGLRTQNRYGVIVYEIEQRQIIASTQLFQNGEIWGFSARLIVRRPEYFFPLIPTFLLERTYYNALRNYLGTLRNLRIEPPYTAEAGVVGLEGARFVMPQSQYLEPFWGPVHNGTVAARAVLASIDDGSLNEFLLRFFEQLFDRTGHRRPAGLHKFPPGPPD